MQFPITSLDPAQIVAMRDRILANSNRLPRPLKLQSPSCNNETALPFGFRVKIGLPESTHVDRFGRSLYGNATPAYRKFSRCIAGSAGLPFGYPDAPN
jgi:hypothetical protein